MRIQIQSREERGDEKVDCRRGKNQTVKVTVNHLFNKFILSTSYVSGCVPGPGDTAVNRKDKNPCSHDSDIFRNLDFIL